MVKIFFFLIVVGLCALVLSRRLRERFMEELKALSDLLLLLLLRATSQFGSELTQDGSAEQKMWRQQRLRDLRGLALRSHQRQQMAKEKSS